MTLSTDHTGSGGAQPMAGAGRALLSNRYEIDPTTPLDSLSRPGAKAYAAVDINEPSRAIYAVVANARQPVRLRAYHQTRQIQSETFITPIRIGSVEWPLSGRNETVLVLPRPAGLPLMESLDSKVDPVPHHRLVRVVLPPIVEMLDELASYRVAHRAIRPDNIFLDADAGTLSVGECFSVPAGMSQPALFEPLERAVCQPEGRGDGDVADDLFALGVTVLFLALGQNPVADIDPETMLQRRRQLGTYAALVGKRRVPTELIQMLRSLLRDEPADRWSVEDLFGWLHNGRGSVAPGAPKVECSRPFEFGERMYKSAPTLAHALADNWPAAVEVVKSGKIDKWLDKALKDKRCEAALARCRTSGASGPRTISDDLLTARTLIALDPNSPLRYRNIAVMPDGIGAFLARHFDDSARLKTLMDMLNGMLPAFWMEQKNRPNYSMFNADEALNRVMPLLAQQAAGFGVERLLYELNPGLTCQSPIVADANCMDVTQLLRALDDRATAQDAVFDRHVAAFIATRISGSIDRDLNDIALAGQAGDKLLAQLRLFAYVQAKSDALELPGLCRFFLGKSPAVLESYRNVELRAKLAKGARAAAETGELARLEKVLGNEKNRRWDTNGFNTARKLYTQDETDATTLQESFATIPDRARSAGKQIGALGAGAASLATTVVVLMTHLH